MISIKLLSAIIGLQVKATKPVRQTNIIRYSFDAIGEIRDSSINKFELLEKCKNWLLKQEGIFSLEIYHQTNHVQVEIADSDGKLIKSASWGDEFGAVITLCEWQLKENECKE